MGVVDHPAETLAPVGQGVIDLVHRLGQRGQALGHRAQPGGGSGELGAARVFGRIVSKADVPEQQAAGRQPK